MYYQQLGRKQHYVNNLTLRIIKSRYITVWLLRCVRIEIKDVFDLFDLLIDWLYADGICCDSSGN